MRCPIPAEEDPGERPAAAAAAARCQEGAQQQPEREAAQRGGEARPVPLPPAPGEAGMGDREERGRRIEGRRHRAGLARPLGGWENVHFGTRV